MAIALFSDTFGRPDKFGMGRYAAELAARLPTMLAPRDAIAACVHCTSNLTRENPSSPIQPQRVGWGRKATAAAWTFLNAPKLEQWLPDLELVHSLDLDYPVPTHKPLVVTVHDLGPLTHPEFFSAGRPRLKRAAIAQAIRQAAAIICVSAATATEVQNYAQQDVRDRISVVYEGVSSVFMTDLPSLPEGDGPFFLYPGSVNPRKNLDRVLKAFEIAAKDIPHHLVLVGKLGWDATATLSLMQNSPLSRRIHFLGFISDLELAALYQKATALIYVSLYEGFGLPILEAMASGCPVITSNISSLPEVAGDAGLQVNPFSVEQIAQALILAACDRDLVRCKIEQGKQRVSQFSWQKCAEQVAQVYKTVLG
jgi:glycosyltransferase involved in cell wall biosynthesis